MTLNPKHTYIHTLLEHCFRKQFKKQKNQSLLDSCQNTYGSIGEMYIQKCSKFQVGSLITAVVSVFGDIQLSKRTDYQLAWACTSRATEERILEGVDFCHASLRFLGKLCLSSGLDNWANNNHCLALSLSPYWSALPPAFVPSSHS